MSSRWVLIGIVLWLAAADTAEAQRVALVIGIADYTFSPKLLNPHRDATRLSATLEQLGFAVTTVLDSDLNQFVEGLERFYARAEGAEAALFYYAGHGLQLEGINYLVPRDAQLRSEARVRQEAIALQDIISSLERRSKITLIFLDACRDNPLAEVLQRSLGGGSRSATVARGLAPMSIRNPDMLLVFAAAPGRTASDGAGKNSPFAQALLENIVAPGVDIEVVMKRVTRAVAETTHGDQIPERLSRLTSDFVFSTSGSGASSREFSQASGAYDAQKPSSEATAAGIRQSPDPCIPLAGANGRVMVRAGSIVCAENGIDRAVILKLVPRAVVYSVNGRETTCKPSDLCQFNWDDGPFFRVLISDEFGSGKATTATLVLGR